MRLLCAYASKDRDFYAELASHLKLLKDDGILTEVIGVQDMLPGEAQRQTTDDRVKGSDLFLLLISIDFLNSDFYRDYLDQMLDRFQGGESWIIPVRLRAVHWDGELAGTKLTVIPEGGKTIIEAPDRDQRWSEISAAVAQVVANLRERRAAQDSVWSPPPSLAQLPNRSQRLLDEMAKVLYRARYTIQRDQSITEVFVPLVAVRMAGLKAERYYFWGSAEIVTERHLAPVLGLRRRRPDLSCFMVSEAGFTAGAEELARGGTIECLTYHAFRRRLIDTAGYEDMVLGAYAQEIAPSVPEELNVLKPLWKDLKDLEEVYQVPKLEWRVRDQVTPVTNALLQFDQWLESRSQRWVSLIGDYGSGKTALTKMLLLRWMRRYQEDGTYLPIRIELRDFAKKFDFEGLLIYFCRHHNLEGITRPALENLIEEGRVVFLLDGYDEMAQNLSVMDRRDCLVALAKTLSGKSTGIITSRPNYFTQADELRVAQILYDRGRDLHRLDHSFLLREKEVDNFLDRYYYRRAEAHLSDLSRAQVQALMQRRLGHDPAMLASVQDILATIYGMGIPETEDEGGLGTKPVVVTYLLEIAENLDDGDVRLEDYRPMDDWGIYRLILDRLIKRDEGRTSGIVSPGQRREFLQNLAVELSATRRSTADTSMMLDLVRALFEREIRRVSDVSSQEDTYFIDVRSSASLTSKGEKWSFSHNSLREFLVAEAFIEALNRPDMATLLRRLRNVPATQGLIRFLAASYDHLNDLPASLRLAYGIEPEVLLNLFLPVLSHRYPNELIGQLESIVVDRRIAKVLLSPVTICRQSFVRWTFEEVIFDHAEFLDCIFKECRFSDCTFYDCTLTGSTFDGCVFLSPSFDGIELRKTTFPRSRFRDEELRQVSIGTRVLVDDNARAYLRFAGAEITPGRDLNEWQFATHWGDLRKVMEQLLKEHRAWKQYRGLTQRGSIEDPVWTRGLVDTLVGKGYCEHNKSKDVRLVTEHLAAAELVLSGQLPDFIQRLLQR